MAVGLGLALGATVACGLDGQRAGRPKDPEPEFSAERLDLAEQDSILDVLEPEEREAVDRTGISGARPEHVAKPGDETDSKADTAGKVSLSVLSVALSVGAAVAPFFLF
jgi:hypothetical protein